MSGCKKPNPIVLMFSSKNKNWNDSTESIQKQKISKLTKSDASLKVDQVDLLLLKPDPFRPGRFSAPEKPLEIARREAAPSTGGILHVKARKSTSGELAVMKVNLSRPQSRIFLPEGVAEQASRRVFVAVDIVSVVENSEDAPKDRVPWKYLRRSRVYKEQKGKLIISWLNSIHFHYSRVLGRRRMILSCPNCTFPVKTAVRHVSSVRTRRSACALTAFGLCGLPYLWFLFKDVVHVCPFCSVYLGFCPAFKYPRKADVVTDVITPVSMTSLLKLRRGVIVTCRNAIQMVREIRDIGRRTCCS